MQFFTISKSRKSEWNKPFFQKKIAYHNEHNTIKPSSSMLLHHHFISVSGDTELQKLLGDLDVLKNCQVKRNGPISVDYHLRKNTPTSQQFKLQYLTNILGFPEEIDNFKLNSIGVNVEKALFLNQPTENKHIQIVYSSKDNKIFQCIKKDNSVSKNNSYNEFIFNLHIAPSAPTTDPVAAQLENIAHQAQNIANDQIFRDLIAMEITPQHQTVQNFYDTVFYKGSYPNGYYSNGRYYNKGKFQSDYKLKLDKVNGIVVALSSIKNLPIGQEMLALPPAAAPIVTTNDNPGVPPAADIDDTPILDNIANNSSDGSDLTSLTSKISNALHIDDNLQNTDLSSSGESSEDTPATL